MKRLVYVLLFCFVVFVPVYGQSPVTDGLIVHVAADEISGASNGDYIKTWRDLSDNGNDLYQNSSDLKPMYVENVVGGQPAVRFDGLNDMMNFTYEMTDIRTIFFVLNEDADAEDDWKPFLSHHLGENNHWHRGESKAFWSVYWGRWEVYNGTTTVNGLVVDGRDDAAEPAVIPTVHSIISHVTKGDVPADQIAHDRDASINTRSWDGDIAEILIFNRVLSSGETDAVGYYLANKYGIDSVYEMLYAIRPQDGAEGVPVDVIFEWGAGSSAVTGFDVYMGFDPNNLELVSERQTETTFEPNSLAYESSYAWQVIAYEPNEISGLEEQVPGPVWTFTTRAEVPYIAVQPQNTWARIGETAQFSIVAESSSEMHYDWYKVVEGGDDISFGVDSDVFELEDVQLDDEGYYYCIVTNDSGPEQSEEAFLTAGRVIARWEFEDDLLDKTDNDWDGVVVGGDPNFTGGINGKAIEFLGDSNLYIEIPGSNDGLGFDMYLGYSLSAWVKTNQGGWGAIISKSTRESDDTEPFEGIVLSHWEEWAAHQVRGVGDAWGWMPIFDEQWHFIVGSYDAQTGMAGIYVDGLFEEEIGPVYTFSITSEPFIIGNELTTTEPSSTSSPFEGLVDDLRVYNYPLPATEIGQRYAEYAGAFCVGNPESDLSGDCVVNIEDLAMLAAGWLECNLFPDCVDIIE